MPIYLDNHASTPIAPEVLQTLTEAYTQFSGNPHSEHNLYGRIAKEAIDSASETIAKYFSPYMEYSQVCFTSGATEANNLALIGTIGNYLQESSDKNSIIISAIEHKSVQTVAQNLARKHGLELLEAPVAKDGRVDLQFFEDKINSKTAIVSVQATNSEIGVNQDIISINGICKHYGVVFHSDMAQSAYLDICQGEEEIDLISLSGHKRYAPQGIGALMINSFGVGEISPIILGGGQQNNVRSGTMPTAMILALAKAMEVEAQNKQAEVIILQELRDIFLKELIGANVRFSVNASMEFRHPGNINITLQDIDAFDLIARTERDIAISTSSACTSFDGTPSYILQAIGLPDDKIRKTIRIGIGRFTTEQDICAAVKIIAKAIGS